MREVNVIRAGIPDSFPQVDESRVDALPAGEIKKSSRKSIVLDDDPTGVQTVHDICLYGLEHREHPRGLCGRAAAFLSADQFARLYRGTNYRRPSGNCRGNCRGLPENGDQLLDHKPGRFHLTGTLSAGNRTFESWSGSRRSADRRGNSLPFLPGGGPGRFTIGDIHYVRDGDRLIPAGQTEFAKDRTFGYRSPDLKDYVEEKPAAPISPGRAFQSPSRS